MGNFEIGDYLVGITIFILVTMCVVFLIGGIAENRPGMITDSKYTDFNKSFDKYHELSQDIETEKDKLNNSTPGDDSGLLSSINSLIKTAFSGVKFVLITFTVMDDAYLGINTQLGIPLFVTNIIKILITILILFAIYKLIFRSPTV